MLAAVDWLIPLVQPVEGNVSLDVLVYRLLLSAVLGGVVAGLYALRQREGRTSTFPATLLFLAILISMLTQVIGESVARAFSLVGALSIVRFRTVVRDTQDTAFVIFSVAVGMAAGANQPLVAGVGIAVICVAIGMLSLLGWFQKPRVSPIDFSLAVRLAVGVDPDQLLSNIFQKNMIKADLRQVGTAQKGASLDLIYHVRVASTCSPAVLTREFNLIEGVQSVEFRRLDGEDAV